MKEVHISGQRCASRYEVGRKSIALSRADVLEQQRLIALNDIDKGLRDLSSQLKEELFNRGPGEVCLELHIRQCIDADDGAVETHVIWGGVRAVQ